MDPEFNDDSNDTSDEDYSPAVEGADVISGSDASDIDDDQLEDNDDEINKPNGRKQSTKKRTKRGQKEIPVVREPTPEPADRNSDDEKSKAEALWADFLGSSDKPPSPKKSNNDKLSITSNAIKKLVPATATSSKVNDIPSKPKDISKIFEFAGETVQVPVKSEPEINTTNAADANASPKSNLNAVGVKRPLSSGVSSVLSQLTKKNKLSVLEKTKVDWDSFKSNEGITEELQTHNRGRNG